VEKRPRKEKKQKYAMAQQSVLEGLHDICPPRLSCGGSTFSVGLSLAPIGRPQADRWLSPAALRSRLPSIARSFALSKPSLADLPALPCPQPLMRPSPSPLCEDCCATVVDVIFGAKGHTRMQRAGGGAPRGIEERRSLPSPGSFHCSCPSGCGLPLALSPRASSAAQRRASTVAPS
jgi:hypothetical protein